MIEPYTHRLPNGKVAFTLHVDGTLVKLARREHKLLKPEGWAIDADGWEIAKRKGCRRIRIEALDEGQTYEMTAEAFDSRPIVKAYPGYGRQFAQPLGKWVVVKPNNQGKLL